MSEIILSEQNFDQEVLNSQIPVLVDFWAEWCGPCKALGPIISQIAEEKKDVLKVAKLNVDENNNLAMRYGIMSIPTMKLFKDGKIVAELIGAQPKENILSAITPKL